ncbi:uncharacterized protein TNCV_800971 [Trichonephila clavipes]|nr:uncharacterized protein TNCV_800971 [Trichonephila clavipes]
MGFPTVVKLCILLLHPCCERLSKATKILQTPSGSLPQINLGVQGRALDWFEVLGYRVVEDKATDYAHLKQALSEQFPVVINKSELETRFFASSQKHNEKPSNFVYDLLNIQKVLKLEMTEEKLIHHIISRLEPQILDYVEVRHPQTTSNLLQIIDKYEERFLNRKIRAKERHDFVSTLPVIQDIHVPRLVIGKGRIIIHGLADASTAAYGAVLYTQSISEEDVSKRLLCSKSCVAPVKPITIYLVWNCVLLSQLLEKFLDSMVQPIQQIMLRTESNIVLAWIQPSPEQLKAPTTLKS